MGYTGFCGYCGFYGEMVFVHSHYQCPRCKNNIAPCCEGETADENPEDTQRKVNSTKNAGQEKPEIDEN